MTSEYSPRSPSLGKPDPAAPALLPRPDGATIAYHRLEGAGPGVVFLGGFQSDMSGTKACALEAHCRAAGHAFVRFDYFGHGLSSGRFGDGTIGRWHDDSLAVIDQLTTGKLILVGSSMGGWQALLAARARPERVCGLIGIAAAPDFTEALFHHELDDAERATLIEQGVLHLPSDYGPKPYAITRRLIEEARAHLVLSGPLKIGCPVRLFHGMCDTAVPWRTALAIAKAIEGDDVVVDLIKAGDHRLSHPEDLARLFAATDELARSA